jgi:hypothetical protein
METKKTKDKLTNKDKIVIAILSGWSLIHLIFLSISDGRTSYFWPFDKDPSVTGDYDFSEFAVYAIIPWIVFGIYKLLNIEKKETI